MQETFAIVLFVVVGVAAVAAVVSLIMSGDTFGQIGRGGMSIGEDRSTSAAEREMEVRQMVAARAARRAARGETVGDVDAEVRALLAPSSDDPGLEAEVRELVEARNARRVSRGEEPLDVDAEVARRLRDLRGL